VPVRERVVYLPAPPQQPVPSPQQPVPSPQQPVPSPQQPVPSPSLTSPQQPPSLTSPQQPPSLTPPQQPPSLAANAPGAIVPAKRARPKIVRKLKPQPGRPPIKLDDCDGKDPLCGVPME
jgi:hypothetical protein